MIWLEKAVDIGSVQTNGNTGLLPTVQMMQEFCVVLADMEWNGIAIDPDALSSVKRDYLKEQSELKHVLDSIAANVMGDTPINLGSPEQLSTLIYSRKVHDKAAWAQAFNIGTDSRGKPLRRPRMSPAEFASTVRKLTTRIRKTKAAHCTNCKGKGTIMKYTKAGAPYKNLPKCDVCDGAGIVYRELPEYAGLKQSPSSIEDVSALGFKTSKDVLNFLAEKACNSDDASAEARQFLTSMVRLNAVDTYLSSFVGGIERNTRPDNLLHCNFNQCVTSTARLSSSDPNFQNQPRGNTFPIRRVVVSRFPGGVILEGDFAQLEFRVAGELSGDLQVKADVESKFDVHSYTASILNSTAMGLVTKDQRQDAKPNTFKPLIAAA